MIPSYGKKASIPTLANLVASLPQFQHPFTTTIIRRSPELASASDEETVGKYRSHIMEGIRLLNEVFAHTKKAHELWKRVQGISEGNVLLVNDLSESIRYQNELKNLNTDLQIKADYAIGYRLVLSRELEEKTQQF
ncbi:unnamed protein product [Lactuca saligna]|uniref:Uncharacterized protein n=1 Tax=Lactuca saligna TaxID=75948 RepID=A0AA35V777_LACSI|nr:unnamed protein product [Lactuca saligna]